MADGDTSQEVGKVRQHDTQDLGEMEIEWRIATA